LLVSPGRDQKKKKGTTDEHQWTPIKTRKGFMPCCLIGVHQLWSAFIGVPSLGPGVHRWFRFRPVLLRGGSFYSQQMKFRTTVESTSNISAKM
jgi:hypothetical protein